MPKPESFRLTKSCECYCKHYDSRGHDRPWCCLHEFEIDIDDPDNTICDDHCEEDEEL